MKSLIRILPVLFLAHSVASRAEVIVGPYLFEDAGLIDEVSQVEGATWANGWLDGLDSHYFAYTFAQLVASQWDGIVLLGATDVSADMVFEARFTNNILVNAPGSDLVFFDTGAPDANGYDIAIQTNTGYSDFVTYPARQAIDIGVDNPYWWHGPNAAGLVWLKTYAIEIDLSDFGLPEGGTTTAFRFRGEAGADPSGAAALHLAPVATRKTTWGAVKALYR